MLGSVLLFVSVFLIYLWLTGRSSFDEIISALITASVVTFIWGSVEKDKHFALKLFLLKFVKFLLVFPIYIAIFVFEMIKANIDVAWRVVSPSLPVRPGIVEYRLPALKSKVLQLLFANSITLTPGTMTVDIEGSNFYVHRIDIKERSLLPLLFTLLKWVDRE